MIPASVNTQRLQPETACTRQSGPEVFDLTIDDDDFDTFGDDDFNTFETSSSDSELDQSPGNTGGGVSSASRDPAPMVTAVLALTGPPSGVRYLLRRS